MTGSSNGGAEGPWTGGCACGAVRYSIAGKPVAMVECHCRQCQMDSGTDHAAHVAFMGAAVTLTGRLSTWDMTADSGAVKTRGFCPVCGTPVTLTFAPRPDFFSVRAASLDDPSRYAPQVVTYAALRWTHIPGNAAVPTFPGMPPR
jgi:hypothetical protein